MQAIAISMIFLHSAAILFSAFVSTMLLTMLMRRILPYVLTSSQTGFLPVGAAASICLIGFGIVVGLQSGTVIGLLLLGVYFTQQDIAGKFTTMPPLLLWLIISALMGYGIFTANAHFAPVFGDITLPVAVLIGTYALGFAAVIKLAGTWQNTQIKPTLILFVPLCLGLIIVAFAVPNISFFHALIASLMLACLFGFMTVKPLARPLILGRGFTIPASILMFDQWLNLTLQALTAA
jgi:hypothetical protein